MTSLSTTQMLVVSGGGLNDTGVIARKRLGSGKVVVTVGVKA